MVLLARDGLPSTVLVIGAGVKERSVDMFKKIYALGLRLVVVDEEAKTWVADLERSGIVYRLVIVPDVSKRPQNDELCDLVIQAVLAASVGQIHGVYNAFNKHLLLSSLVAQRLGVITNEHHAVERCVFKHQTRACLVSAGLESWTSFNVTTYEEMEHVVTLMTYPAVLKPAKGAGSVGVIKVESASEALEDFANLKALWPDSIFILEEYIDGPEFGVELVMEAGSVVFCSVMDLAKQKTGRHFQGTGRSFPVNQNPLVQAWIASHCITAVKALGLTTGVLDIDVRHSQLGPRILEVNARMGGGSTAIMHELVYKVDLIEVHLKTLLGISVAHLASCIPSDPTLCYEVGWVMSPRSGIVASMGSFVEDIRSMFQLHPNVVSIMQLVGDGSPVVGYNDNDVPSSLIQVLTKATRKHFAEQYLSMVLCTAEERITDLVPDAVLRSPCQLLPSIGTLQHLPLGCTESIMATLSPCGIGGLGFAGAVSAHVLIGVVAEELAAFIQATEHDDVVLQNVFAPGLALGSERCEDGLLEGM